MIFLPPDKLGFSPNLLSAGYGLDFTFLEILFRQSCVSEVGFLENIAH
jgi:hypothetical protein